MRRVWGRCLVVFACAGLACSTLQAQEVVHALTGLVTAVHPAQHSITVKTNDGSEGYFNYEKELHTPIQFDKSVQAETTEPGTYNKVGDWVVVYYIGDGDERTVVALKDSEKLRWP